jgi:adenylate cyclase
LAKVVEGGTRGNADVATALQTRDGVVMGTVPYMSPEQVAGRSIDPRSDIFSLGVMLYEMSSGQRPFMGDSSAELASSILRDTPRPLGEVRPELPSDLARIIRRCLEKDPRRRIQTARDVSNELGDCARAPATMATSKRAPTEAGAIPGFGGRPAIAVLPFDNLSGDPEQEHFADGLAEDLITRLSMWRSFPVIARSSSVIHKGKVVDVKQVGADLGVRYVVLGSVRKSGIRVRIAAQLIDATTGQHAWAKTYDRELTDVFAVQDEISEAIATSLVGDLQRAEHARVMRRPPENLEAWELYQRALPLVHRFTREDSAQARALLERAIVLDPRFSAPLGRLAEVGIWEILYDWTDEPERTLDVALDQARRAVALDPSDAEAHADLSYALMTAGDRYGALEEGRRAVDLNPSLVRAVAVHAYNRHMAGHPPEESIDLMQRAMRLSPHDPLEWLFYDVLAGAYLNAGRFAEGMEAGRRLIVLSPTYYWGYVWSAMNAAGLGRIEEAHDLIREARQVKPHLSFELARKCLGAMAPDVERRFANALHQAGLQQARS